MQTVAALRGDLEYRAVVKGSAPLSCPVKNTLSVQDNTSRLHRAEEAEARMRLAVASIIGGLMV
jgi:hypothetical protein